MTVNQATLDRFSNSVYRPQPGRRIAYVAGLLFDDFDNVALIEKNRPAWQAGKLNAIGGKVERGESALQAIRREFEEETGAYVHDWECFAVLTHGPATVYFFEARATGEPLTSATDEIVAWYPVGRINKPTIPNLAWLIPLAVSGNGECVIADDPNVAVFEEGKSNVNV